MTRKWKSISAADSILCIYDPLGDFTGKTLDPIEINPIAFEFDTIFKNTQTGQIFTIREVRKNGNCIYITENENGEH